MWLQWFPLQISFLLSVVSMQNINNKYKDLLQI